MFVRCSKPLGNLRSDRNRFFNIDRSSLQPLREILAFDKLHDEERYGA